MCDNPTTVLVDVDELEPRGDDINADELRGFDYNQEYNPEALYEASPFRSSDHDPVLIGIAQ